MEPINVKDVGFGAIGDGALHPLSGRYATLADAQAVFPFVTDLSQEIDWAAIQAAIWRAGTPKDPRGSTVLVPSGNYRCSDDLHISRQIKLTGMGRGATQLTFAPGAGVVVDDFRTSPDGGHGSYSTIADLDIAGERISDIQQWEPGRPYAKDALVWDRNDNRFHYRCLKAGVSRPTAPPWTAGAPYNAGDVVRADGPIYFQCIKAGGTRRSGLVEPVWALPVDETTWDGTGAETHESPDFLHWRRLLALKPGMNPGTWTGGVIYNQGDVVEATFDFKRRLFFRSQMTVNAGPSEPAWEADAPGEITIEPTAAGNLYWERGVLVSRFPFIEFPPWKKNTKYELGALVRSDPFDPTVPVLFECTGAGTSGPGPNEPAWNPLVGGTTPDLGVTWTCRADPSVFKDGDAWWCCRASPGIWLRTQAYVQNVSVSGFTNAGILIQSQDLFEGLRTPTNVNHWQLYNAAIHACGLGVAVLGTDCQGGTAVGLEIASNGYDLSGQILPRGNGGTGVYDRGNGPNNWIGCLTESNTGRVFVAATSNAASTVLGCYIEGGQQPSYLGDAGIKINSQAEDAPNSRGWIVDSVARVGPFVVPNPADNGIKLWVGYRSDDPTVLYVWRKDGKENWFVRWDETRQIWRTGSLSDGLPPASYLTDRTHPRGAFLQGLPSVLLGDPALNPAPIQVGAFSGEPPWEGQPGDIVFNSAQDLSDPLYQPYAGWICVLVPRPPPQDPVRRWRRFGKIELEPGDLP